MNNLFSVLKKPYPLEDSTKKVILKGIGIGFFTFIANIFLQEDKDKWLVVVLFCLLIGVIASIYFWLPKLLLRSVYKNGKWLVFHQIIFSFFLILLIALFNYQLLLIFKGTYFSFLKILPKICFIGLVLSFFFTLNDYYIHLKSTLKLANELNISLAKKIQSIAQENEKSILLFSSETDEKIHLKLSTLLFVRAAGNYVEIKTNTSKKLLRTSMNSIELQLKSYPSIIRCHRSYLVNLEQIKSSKGNSHSLILHLKNSQTTIPVSRGYYKRLISSELFTLKSTYIK